MDSNELMTGDYVSYNDTPVKISRFIPGTDKVVVDCNGKEKAVSLDEIKGLKISGLSFENGTIRKEYTYAHELQHICRLAQ